MLSFAWSLVSSAVQYSRRKCLYSLLRQFLLENNEGGAGLHCRSIRDRFKSPSGFNFYERLRKAPSEPVLNSLGLKDEVLFKNDDLEVVVSKQTLLNINDWIPSFNNDNHLIFKPEAQRITFVIRVEPLFRAEASNSTGMLTLSTQGTEEAQDALSGYSIDQFGNKIAKKKDSYDELLYETTLDDFCTIAMYWAESNLVALNGNWKVVEINIVELPQLRDICNEFDSFSMASSTNSISVYPSFKSLNLCRSSSRKYEGHPRRPYTLLELLYQKERGTKYGGTPWKSAKPKSIYASDTALNSGQGFCWQNRVADSPIGNALGHNWSKSSVRYRSLSPSVAASSVRSVPLSKLDPYSGNLPYFKHLRQRGHSAISSSSVTSREQNPSRSSTIENFSETQQENEGPEFFPKTSLDLQPDSARGSTSGTSDSKIVLEIPEGEVEQSADTPRDTVAPLSTDWGVEEWIQRKSRTRNLSLVYRHTREFSMAQDISVPLNDAAGIGYRKRVQSLVPSSCLGVNNRWNGVADGRRRSLSPLSLTLLANFGSREEIDLVNYRNGATLTTDFVFHRRNSLATPKRLYETMSRRNSAAENGDTEDKPVKLHAKPPPVLVYTSDNADLYNRIVASLQRILPSNVYTLTHLSTVSLKSHPWIDENAACLLIADTKLLDDASWAKLQTFFVHSGKILFVCQNSLCASLTNCDSSKKQSSILKSAFGSKVNGVWGKDFEQFMKKSMKSLKKTKQINETFHAKDPVGGYTYSIVLSKSPEQPLLLYMENSEHKASALFSDATTEELLSESGQLLISEALTRLGVELAKEPDQETHWKRGYLICQEDKMVMELAGLKYGEEVGTTPRMIFQPTLLLQDQDLPSASSLLLPVEVRRRNSGIDEDEFDSDLYYSTLTTKFLGRILMYLPVCESTMIISRSLANAIHEKDGILVVSGTQTKGVGRGGNQWLSPKGCAMFTFDFIIPLDSELGRQLTFVQHILAVAMVDAVISLLEMPDFPLKIKWPNDIYYNRSYKMGGIVITASTCGSSVRCTIGAGLNVSNSLPTVCINDMIPSDCDKSLKVEEVLAETMNKFEYFVDMFVRKGKKEFLKKYHQFWLHSREEVSIIHEENGQKDKVIIRGLDEDGYLEVRSKQSGKVFSVCDDGNTFDLMKLLIHPKGR